MQATSLRTELPTKNTAAGRLNSLTGLRFFAAIYVVLVHSGTGYLASAGAPAWISDFTGRGYVAVSFFYILSGFVLAYTYLRVPLEAPVGWKRFWIARFARIYPAYLLSLLLSLPFSFPGWHGTGVRDSLLVLTMTQSWVPAAANAWNLFAWSLSVEAFFYLCFPFIAGYVRRSSSKTLWSGICILWTLTLIPATILCFSASESTQRALTVIPLIRLPEFLIGVALGRLFLYELAGSRFMERVRSPGVALILAAVILALPWGPLFPLAQNGLLIPLFVWTIYSLARNRSTVSAVLSVPLLVLLGEASYSIYILQGPVREWARVLLAHVSGMHKLDAIVGMVGLIVVSVISFFVVESPAREAIKRVFSGSQRRELHSRVVVQV